MPAGIAASSEKVEFETVKNPLELSGGAASHDQRRPQLLCSCYRKDGKISGSRTDVAKTIEPLVRPHRVQNVGKVQTVVLDPDMAATTGPGEPFGYEKDFALECGAKAAPVVTGKGLRVIRARGRLLCAVWKFAHRCQRARDSIFVSIHFNATNDDPNATRI